MKKHALALLAAAPLILASPARAQTDTAIGLRMPTQKGSIMLGANLLSGSAGLDSKESGGGFYYNAAISPRLGYFIQDNLALGLTLNGSFAGSSNRYHSEGGGLGVFARYYPGKTLMKDGTMRRTRFFIEGGASYNAGIATFRNIDGTRDRQDFNGGSAYIMPGFSHFFTKNIALEGGLYYTRSIFSSNNTSPSANQLGINLGLQFFFRR